MAIECTTNNEGQRIIVHGKEFMISGIKQTSEGNFVLQVRGLSELVKDKTFFLLQV